MSPEILRNSSPYSNATAVDSFFSPSHYSHADAIKPSRAPAVSSPTSGKKRKVLEGMKAERQPLSRAVSTPHVGTSAAEMAESEADKKRNKLGYQRISIACAHCRRRKIRCLVAEGDPHHRCQNCIRLKKECVFYPVDQQSVMENRSQGSNKAAGSVVSSSPPNSEHGNFHGIPTPVTGTFQGLPVEPGSIMPVTDDYGYRPPQELAHSPWTQDAPYSAPSSAVMPPPQSPAANPYWRYGQSSSGDFSPFPHEGHGPPTTQGLDHARGAPHWQAPPPPLRSLSYGHPESMPGHEMYGAPYQQGAPPPPVPSRYAPAPLDIHSASMLSQPHGPRSAPVAPPQMGFGQSSPYMMQHQDHHHQQPQQHASFSGHPGYQQGWYGSGNYPPTEEDSHGSYQHGRPS